MRYFQCKNIVAKAFVFFIGYATFSLFVSESKAEEVVAQQSNIILSQTNSQNSSDTKKNTDEKKPTQSNNTDGKKPTQSNNTDGKKPTQSNNTDGKKPTESNNTDGKKPTESNNTDGKKPTEYNEKLKGTWEGKIDSSQEDQSITYIFGEKDQLYMIYDSSIGKFAVERKYKVVQSNPPQMKTNTTPQKDNPGATKTPENQENPDEKKLKIDIKFSERKIVRTIFKLDKKGNLLIELAEFSSDYPKEFSNFITFTKKSGETKPVNMPISKYQP